MAILQEDPEKRGEILRQLEERFSTKEDGEGLYVVTTEGQYPPADGKNIWRLSQELELSMAETIAQVTVGPGPGHLHFLCHVPGRCGLYAVPKEFCHRLRWRCPTPGAGKRRQTPSPEFRHLPLLLRLAREKGFCTLEEAVHGSRPFGPDHRPEKTEVFSGQRMQADITVFDGRK